MIDPELISTGYKNMTTGELMNFVMEEGNNLTAEACLLLQKEFEVRSMDITIFDSIRNGTFSAHKESILKIENTVLKEFNRTVLANALTEKRDGKRDTEILSHLIENGMEESQGLLLIAQLEKRAQILLEAANNSILASVFIIIAGIAFNMISPQRTVLSITDILTVCAIGYGVIRLLKGLFDKSKFIAVINNIRKQREEEKSPDYLKKAVEE